MKLSYDNTIPEVQTAFMEFWKKYSLKRTILFSLVYAIAIALFVNMILNGTMMFGGIGAGLSAGMLLSVWLRPRRARKRLTDALELSSAETYSASFCDTQIEIETVTENEETQVSVYQLSTEELYSKEMQEMFLLYVNRSLIHVFPKRCMNEQEVEGLRTYFMENRI